MKKQILAAAVAAAVLVPAASAADTNNVTVYGKVDMAVTHYDGDVTVNGAQALSYDAWNLHENGGATKIGFKGTEDLGNGLKAIWKLEMDAFAGRKPTSGNTTYANFVNRNAYVGLAGDWGTALMGRHDTPYKMAFGKWDLFADTAVDFNNFAVDLGDTNFAGQAVSATGITPAFTDRRLQDAVAYVSPSMNGLSLAAAVGVGADPAGSGVDADGFSNADGLADAYSIAVNYSNNGIMAALAYEKLDDSHFNDDPTNLTGTGVSNADDDTLIGAAIGYKGNGFFAGFRYENHETTDEVDLANAAAITGFEFDNYYLTASYDFGNNTVKGFYGWSEGDGNVAGIASGIITPVAGSTVDFESTSWAIGVDHKFSKRTKAYALYGQGDAEVEAKLNGVSQGKVDADMDVFSIGMSHTF